MVREIILQSVYFLAFFYQLNCQSSLTRQQERNAYFLNLINDIPGPEYLLLTDYELQDVLKINEMNETFLICNNTNIKYKMWKLRCKYTELSLYIMYHMKFVIINRNVINSKELKKFKDILHRMISIFYYTFSHIKEGIWLTSITINALIDRKISPQEIKFDYITFKITEICRICFKYNNLPYLPELYKNNSYLSTIYEISKQLKLYSGYYPNTFNEIYQYEDVSHIYSFFWDNIQRFEIFIPPTTMFPTYDKTHIKKIYDRVRNSWKNDYFELLFYTKAIKKNLLLVTYYSLVRHSIYLIDCFIKDINSINSNSEYFFKLFKIPLNIINEIGVFTDETFYSPFQNFLNYMKNDRIINLDNLIKYTSKVLDCLNTLAINFNIPTFDFNSFRNDASIVNPFNHSIAENQLNLFTIELQKYFECVKISMAPVDFTILKIFMLNVNIER
ncbi:uncharacterized protein LOC126898402 [Daktulosphaira vitifoliae]|uniref:uncharacterized protein LOC126898402 n=1 Tax=Daktulosphaira vitifoliae TaxID=58002 RepID=UPI0021AAD652|nr:uncharacterized protein LOC126898402 [Daktulosphaira vitifoliae]